MADNQIKFEGGGSGSKVPRFELIPYIALLRMIERFELGITNRPDGTSWNALSANFRSCLLDKKFVISRAGHIADHALKLKAILAGEKPDDGDDHAGAILWGGAFLACATHPEYLDVKNCSACGGTGLRYLPSVGPPLTETLECPACKGTGKERPK